MIMSVRDMPKGHKFFGPLRLTCSIEVRNLNRCTAFNKDFAVSDQEGISQVPGVDKVEDGVSSRHDDMHAFKQTNS